MVEDVKLKKNVFKSRIDLFNKHILFEFINKLTFCIITCIVIIIRAIGL